MTKSWTWKASRGCEFESNRLRDDDGRVPFHFWQRQKESWNLLSYTTERNA